MCKPKLYTKASPSQKLKKKGINPKSRKHIFKIYTNKIRFVQKDLSHFCSSLNNFSKLVKYYPFFKTQIPTQQTHLHITIHHLSWYRVEKKR